MTTFMDILKNVKRPMTVHDQNNAEWEKDKKEIQKMELSFLGKKKYDLLQKRRAEEDRIYPSSLSVNVNYGNNAMNAHKARNEIETKWNKMGKWVGHGSDLGKGGACDVQVCFKRADIEKAKQVAQDIMKKHNVTGRFTQFDVNKEV
jgi:hypothetical protein